MITSDAGYIFKKLDRKTDAKRFGGV